MSALINEAVLLSGSIVVILHANPRLLEPQVIDVTGIEWLALLGIVINGFAFWLSSHRQSLNTKMRNWHLLGNVLGWIVVLAGSIAMYFDDYLWLDPLMASGGNSRHFYGMFSKVSEVLRRYFFNPILKVLLFKQLNKGFVH